MAVRLFTQKAGCPMSRVLCETWDSTDPSLSEAASANTSFLTGPSARFGMTGIFWGWRHD